MKESYKNSLLGQVGIVPVILALALAGVSSGGENFDGFIGFFALILLAAGLIWVVWHIVREEMPPKWLLLLTLAAALLRLGLGVLWHSGLPVWGYTNEEVQQAGYLMKDAYQRDGIAWKLAQSDTPLYKAFAGISETDQYGGMLYLSAAVYRYFGGETHQSLMFVVLTAAFSSLAVIFTWAGAKHLWGEDIGRWAAWGIALYPEAMMLGSVQMREPFLISIMAAGLYFLLRLSKSKALKDAAWLGGLVLFGAAISLPFAGMLALAAVVMGLYLEREMIFSGNRGWVVSGGLLALAAAIGLALDHNFHWVQAVIKWQTYSSEKVSGRIAKMFLEMPEWAQQPFLVSYGVVRPLLPSALFDESVPLWKIVAVWRALGWTLLLLFLLYATFLIVKDRLWKESASILLLLNWTAVFIASFRGGGDLWDNPRYRAIFASIQVALAAWAWGRRKTSQDPWLGRGLVMVLMLMAWFGPWYIQRKFFDLHWQIWELGDLVGLGLATGILYLIWDWMRGIAVNNN